MCFAIQQKISKRTRCICGIYSYIETFDVTGCECKVRQTISAFDLATFFPFSGRLCKGYRNISFYFFAFTFAFDPFF